MGMSLNSCSSDDNDNSSSDKTSSIIQGTTNSNQTAVSKGAWDFYAMSEGDTIYLKKDAKNAGECYVVAKQYDVKNPETGEITSVYSREALADLIEEYTMKYYDFEYDYDTPYNFYSGDITIPENVTVNGTTYTVTGIGDYAFYNTEITSLKMPSKIRYISDSAIGDCCKLTKVELSEDLREIGTWSFVADSLLTEITLPSKVTKIGDHAFTYCDGLQKINIPSSVTQIGEGAFGGCSKLTSIDVDSNNKYYQFKDGMLLNKGGNILHTYLCTNKASSFSIPEYIDSLGVEALFRCYNLKSVTVNSNITRLTDAAFCWCENLEQVNLPKTIKYIEASAFESCESLKDIVLPESVEYIGDFAFDETALEEINIPAKVKYIGIAAFFECNNLKTIKSYITSPFEISEAVFSNDDTATLYVPSGTKASYEATAGWKEFKNIVEME